MLKSLGKRIQEVWSLSARLWPLFPVVSSPPALSGSRKEEVRSNRSNSYSYSTLSTLGDNFPQSELNWMIVDVGSGRREYFGCCGIIQPRSFKVLSLCSLFSCLLCAAFSQSATTNFLKTPNDSWVFFNQQTCRRRKYYFLTFDRVSPPPPPLFLPSGSPERRLWEAVQHLPQTAHHQNGVPHQSESWSIKSSASLPHHSLSFVSGSRFSASVSLREAGFTGSYTNGLSRICNVAFLWDGTAERRGDSEAVLMLSQEDVVRCCWRILTQGSGWS